MIQPFPPKDPDTRLPHWFDATDFAADEGSAVGSMMLAIDEGDDGALELQDQSRSEGVIVFWPTGGTIDATYTVRCRCTLANGAVADLSRTITIAQT